MALKLAPTFCSCDNRAKYNFLNTQPRCYDGVYFVVGQPYQTDLIPQSGEAVIPVPTPHNGSGGTTNSQQSTGHQSCERNLAVVNPVASTPSSRFSETPKRNQGTSEPVRKTSDNSPPAAPPAPPPFFESPTQKPVFVHIDIANEIKNWHENGNKLRPTKNNGKVNNSTRTKEAMSPVMSSSADEVCEKDEDPRDMVKAALMIRSPAIHGDEDSSEDENNDQDKEDSGSESE